MVKVPLEFPFDGKKFQLEAEIREGSSGWILEFPKEVSSKLKEKISLSFQMSTLPDAFNPAPEEEVD